VTSLRFIGDWSLYLGLAVALLLGAAAWVLYRRESRRRDDIHRWLLPGLRSLAVVMLILMLTGPVLHHRWIVGQLARVLVFVDASRSMGITDQAMAPGRKLLAAAQLGYLWQEVLPRDLIEAQKALSRAAARRLPAQPSAEELTRAAAYFRDDIEAAFDHLENARFDGSMFTPARRGTILYEYWEGFNGSDLAAIRRTRGFPDSPSGAVQVKQFQGKVNWNDHYCSRITGYIYPPTSGEYTFWINSDDQSWLFLSSDESPSNKRQIAKVEDYTPLGAWEQQQGQKSEPIRLVGGRRYYIEALHAEGSGNDHLAVGWRLPDGTMERPIPGSRLAPAPNTERTGPGMTSRKAVLEQFQSELLAPARRLSGHDPVKDPAGFAEDLTGLAIKADLWQGQLRLSFEKWAAKLAQSGAAPVREALERFDRMTRTERVEALLLRGDRPLLERLAENHSVDVIALAENDIRALWHSRAGQASSSRPIPERLAEPVHDATNLSVGLKTAIGIAQGRADRNAAKQPDANRLAVVLISDGRHNYGTSPLHQAKICGSREIPVFTVGLGAVRKPSDLAVMGVDRPVSVFHKDRLKGKIALKDDMPAGKPFVLKVVCGDRTVWQKELATTGLGRRIIDYDFAIEQILKDKLSAKARELAYQSLPLNFSAVIEGLDATDFEPGNNKADFRTRAIFRHNRVLILDGRPRWEFRYVRNLLERDEKWTVTTVLADPTARDGGIERGDGRQMFPGDRELLYSYDLIVLGDFPSALLRDRELEWIRDTVGNRGAGLILVDGLRRHLRSYATTPLGELLPVEWDAEEPITNPQSLRLTEKGVLRLTEQGADVAALMLSGGQKTNTEIWASLKPPHWLSPVTALPGSEVLVEAVLKDQARPAVVFRRFGAGKVLFTAFDETWRWRYRVADEYHQRYWNQVGNLIMASPFAVSDRFVSIDAGSLTYSPGQNVPIRVRIRDTEGRPVSDAVARANILRDGVKIAAIPLKADESRTQYRGVMVVSEPGSYEVRIEVLGYPQDQMLARAQFYVEPPQAGELAPLDCDEGLLKQIAANSNGAFFREEEASALPERLKLLNAGRVRHSDTALWQSYLWFAAVVGLLTIEWVLRKRAGML